MNTSSPLPLVPDHAAPLTKQQAFDLAWKWSRTHGPCVDKGVRPSRCLYRDGQGNACLIGACVPDGIYHEMGGQMEGRSASNLLDKGWIKGLFTPEIDGPWLDSFQGCHDQVALSPSSRSYLERVTERLVAFAADRGLTVPQEN